MIDLGLAATREHPVIMGNYFIGTYRYMAPEIYFSKSGYDQAVDMWALGVGFYTMLTLGMLLPDTKDDVSKALSDPKFVEDKIKKCPALQQRKISKDARNFLNRLLAYDPKKRMTVQQALEHPFIKKTGTLGLNKQKVRWIDGDIVAKMEAFARASPLERIARLAVAHTVSNSPDEELLKVRLMFRTLDARGNGKISQTGMENLLQRANLTLPPNFTEIFAACASSGDAALTFNEFVACNLPQSFLNEKMCAAVFRLLDRDGDGLFGPEDLRKIYANRGITSAEPCDNIVLNATGKTSINSAEFCKFLLG